MARRRAEAATRPVLACYAAQPLVDRAPHNLHATLPTLGPVGLGDGHPPDPSRRAMLLVSLAAAAGCATLSGRARDRAAGPPPPREPLQAAAPLSCPAPA